jgi:hypothetical protein
MLSRRSFQGLGNIGQWECLAPQVDLVLPVGKSRKRSLRAHLQGLDYCLIVGIDEKRNRVSILSVTVNHAMRCPGKKAIRPVLHDIADIDHKAAGQRWCLDPVTLLILYLESAVVVLPQNCETTGI